jgi:hypothetical protein
VNWEAIEPAKHTGWKALTWRAQVGRKRVEVYLGRGGWHYAIGDRRGGINAGSWLFARQARAACEAKLADLGLLQPAVKQNVECFTGCSEVGAKCG